MESCKRLRRCFFFKKKNVIMVISGLLTWCVLRIVERGKWKVFGRIKYALQ